MIDEKKIGERLTRIDGLIREAEPNVIIGSSLRIDAEGTVSFSSGLWRGDTPKHLVVRGSYDSFEAALSAVEKHLAALPSQEERDLTKFQGMVAEALDFGREANIDAAFINPLSDISKRLASNAITKVEAAAPGHFSEGNTE